MSSITPSIFSPTGLMEHLRSPLYRNGYALVLSTVATSGLGVLYWILAARGYTTEAVGLNSATISAMLFLTNVSQLGFGSALNRFLPRAGLSTRGFVLASYAISLFLSLIVSLIFLTGLNLWTPALSILNSNATIRLWFILATMSWSIFALQDGALIGLRQAIWIPIENGIYAVLKIILIVAFAASLMKFGIFASWTLPLIVLIIPVNYLLFRFLIPRHTKETTRDSEPIRLPQTVKFIFGDYISSMIFVATTSLLPIMVVSRAGATANAYFYLPWTITYSLYLVSRNMGMSLTAEAAADQKKMDQYAYRTLVQTGKLLVPAVIIILVCAPLILSLFGADYAAEGSTLLRLLALGMLPNIVITIYLSIARVQNRMKAIILTLSVLCILVLSSSYILLGAYGITGIGIAWLISMSLVATGLFATQLRPILLTVGNFTPWIKIFTRPRRFWEQQRARWWISRNKAFLKQIISTLPEESWKPPPTQWKILEIIPTISDMSVVTVGPQRASPLAVINIARSKQAIQSCRSQLEILESLNADARLGDWRALIPKVLAAGEIGGESYLVMPLLPGTVASQLISEPAARQTILINAAETINELHRRTCKYIIPGEDSLQRWIDEPIHVLRGLGRISEHGDSLERLSQHLYHTIAGRTLPVCLIHGDYWPANILVATDSLRITGIVDWDQAHDDDLPFLDLINLLLSTRILTQNRELGEILQELLSEPSWTADELAVLEHSSFLGGETDLRDMLLLYWLRHTAANLKKSARYARHPVWVVKNIETILHSI